MAELLRIYDIVIDGTSQGVYFQRLGTIYITSTITSVTTNDVNPIDIFIESGSPFASPESGAIWMMTNNALIGGKAQIDMAYVSSTAAQIEIQPDWRVSAVGVNGFNAYSGLLAEVYQIFDGTISLQLENNQQEISGSINILGTGAVYHSNTPYQANIAGTLSYSSSDPLLNTPVNRFYNDSSKGHFFTASTSERDTVLANPSWGYTYEGVGFKASSDSDSLLNPIHRFYNANSRGHFFTASISERDTVLANPSWGYTYEGVGFYAYGATDERASDVYRFYNANSRGHFFTASISERDTVLANPSWGYQYEGVAFEAAI